ncbi:MAG: hypothetical protein AAB510_01785 [Patescibacteria group bacterium]
MKKFIKYSFLALILFIPIVSFAIEFRSGDQVSVKKEEVIANDLYMGGSNATSAGTINGDLFIGGGNVTVSGDVSGDLMAGGGNVNILSTISDDLRVGGGTVVLSGKVGGDLLVAGGQVTLSGDGVGGDASMAGGNMTIDAPIQGDLSIKSETVYINSLIDGNVDIHAQKITLGSAALISGNLKYISRQELVNEGGVVKGETTFTQKVRKNENKKVLHAIFGAFVLWKFFALLASALVIGMMLNRYSRETVAIAKERTLYELGRGFLVFVVMPIISIIFLVTLIGIPFSILTFIGFIAMMIFAWIMAPIILGSVVYQYFRKGELEVSRKTIILGVLLYTVLGFIPLVGWLFNACLLLVSLGAMTSLKLKVLKEWR